MKDTKQQQISKMALFSGCTKADVAFIAAHADSLDVGAGITFAIAGRPAREFIVVVDGVLSGDGVIFGPGSFFGAAELLDGRTYASSIETLTDARVLVFGPREFRALLARVPTVAKTLMRDLVARVRVQDERSLRAVS